MTDKNPVPGYLTEANTDVFQQADVDGIFQVGVKIEQDIDSRLANRPDMPEHLLRLRVMQLRFERNVEALQAVRDGPAKQGQVTFRGASDGDGLQKLQQARFVAGIDRHNGRSGTQYQLKIVLSVHGQGLPGAPC